MEFFYLIDSCFD